MENSSQESQDLDQRIADMEDSIADLRRRCYSNSAFRVASDLARLARREQCLIPLLSAQFEVVNLAQGLFLHHPARAVAIEMIALLESPERARQIQPDYSEDEYAETCAWMTACAYDNLAKHTGDIQGYNSEGMHQCIADGIEVCRRTGKLRCITCFREYAANVYLASDDSCEEWVFLRTLPTTRCTVFQALAALAAVRFTFFSSHLPFLALFR